MRRHRSYSNFKYQQLQFAISCYFISLPKWFLMKRALIKKKKTFHKFYNTNLFRSSNKTLRIWQLDAFIITNIKYSKKHCTLMKTSQYKACFHERKKYQRQVTPWDRGCINHAVLLLFCKDKTVFGNIPRLLPSNYLGKGCASCDTRRYHLWNTSIFFYCEDFQLNIRNVDI